MILIKPSIDPIILSLGIFDIRWYSLAYIASFIIGSIIIKYLNKKFLNVLSNKQIEVFFIWSILGVIIGGRVGYVLFYQTSYFFTDPILILKIWMGGMSFHGGLVGIIISMYLFAKKNKINFFYLSDLVSIVAPIGLFFGRIANFINNELYGRVTDFPFAMIYPEIDLQPRHPSQLYESFFEGVVLFIILFTLFNKTKSEPNIGKISGLFLIFYSMFRIFIEFLRQPDSQIGLILNIATMGQILSIPLLIIGFMILKKS